MLSKEGPILFYDLKKPYGQFSNFYRSPIILKDVKWPTSEHYYQAMKFEGTEHEEIIRKLERPRSAFEYVRNPLIQHLKRKDWESKKINVMKEALQAKFNQNIDLKMLLLGTRDRFIFEHTENDDFWGDGGNFQGKNQLGLCLMELREELRQEKSIEKFK